MVGFTPIHLVRSTRGKSRNLFIITTYKIPPNGRHTGRSRSQSSQSTTNQDCASSIKCRNTSLLAFRNFVFSALPCHVLNLSFCHAYKYCMLLGHSILLCQPLPSFFHNHFYVSPPDNLHNSIWHSSPHKTVRFLICTNIFEME